MTPKKKPIKKRAPGGGRKPLLGKPLITVSVSLTASQIEYMTEQGHGNLSDGARVITDRDRLANQEKVKHENAI